MKAVAALFLVAVALCGAGVAQADEFGDGAPVILFHKGLDSEEQGYVLADQNFTVHYQIFNVGDAAAFGLSFKDNWPEDSFDVIEGQFEGEFESLDAGANVSMSVVVVPKHEGVFDASRAVLEYHFGEDDEKVDKVVHSSTFGRTEVLSSDDYARKTQRYSRQYTTFTVLASGPVLIPLALYMHLSKEADNALVNKKDA